MNLAQLRLVMGIGNVMSPSLRESSSFVCHLGGDLGQLSRFDFDSWLRSTGGG